MLMIDGIGVVFSYVKEVDFVREGGEFCKYVVV